MLAPMASPRRLAPARWQAALALLLALTILPVLSLPHPLAPFAPASAPAAPAAAIPAAMRARVFAQLGSASPSYHLQAAPDGSLRAPSVAGMAATLSATTLRLGDTTPDWAWTLSGWGRAATLAAPTAPASAVVHANQARYAMGDLESWYVAGPGGLEQGWTVVARPAGDGPLHD